MLGSSAIIKVSTRGQGRATPLVLDWAQKNDPNVCLREVGASLFCEH